MTLIDLQLQRSLEKRVTQCRRNREKLWEQEVFLDKVQPH